MLTHHRENGVAQELQRIEQEFNAQRDSLQTESAHFAAWQLDWENRQRMIDAALMQLKSRLQNSREELAPIALKLFSSPEG